MPPAAPAFQEAIQAVAHDRGGRLSSLKLGHLLRGRKGTVVNGYRLIADRDTSNTTIWRAEKL